MKKIISKLKSLFSKETKQTETYVPIGLTGAELLKWWKTINPDSVITGVFTDQGGKCCVIGHYKRCTSKDPGDYSVENTHDGRDRSSRTFRGWSIQAMVKLHKIPVDVAEVNNGTLGHHYPEKTPYLRVLKFFEEVKAYEEVNGSVYKEINPFPGKSPAHELL